MIRNDKLDFNGDIVIVPRFILDRSLSLLSMSPRSISCDALYVDTTIGAECPFSVYDEKNREIGSIDDGEGGCELCVFHSGDIFNLLKVSNLSEMLDLFYKAYGNDNISRNQIDPLEVYSMSCEIKNFKGTVEIVEYTDEEFAQMEEDEVYSWDIATIKGVNTLTGEDINYRLSITE